MNLRETWEHELGHAAADAIALLSLGGRAAYDFAEVYLEASGDGHGECAVVVPGEED